MNNIKNFTWDGLTHATFSFAIVTRNMCKALNKIGVDVSLNAWGDIQNRINDPEIEFLSNKPINRDIGLRISSPDSWYILSQFGIKEKIGYLPWELNYISKEQVNDMLRSVNWILALSENTKQCFIRSGIPEYMIKVIPCGVDLDLFNKEKAKKIRFKCVPDDFFKFLHLGTPQPRKASEILLEVFDNEFKKDEKVSLIIKSYDPCGEKWEQTWLKNRDINNSPLVYYEYQKFGLDDNKIPDYYNSCDCYVSTPRAEGFGQTMIESMAMGLPVITSENGGQRDFCNEKNSFLIKGKEVPTTHWFCHDMNGKLKWHDPDKRQLADIMRKVFEEWKRKGKGNICLDKIEEGYKTSKEFTWEKAAIKFRDAFLIK